MMTWLAFGGAAFRGAAFAFGALTATSTRTASELDAALTASTTTVGTFAGFAFALALFPARTFLTSLEARNLALFTFCFLGQDLQSNAPHLLHFNAILIVFSNRRRTCFARGHKVCA